MHTLALLMGNRGRWQHRQFLNTLTAMLAAKAPATRGDTCRRVLPAPRT